MPCAVPAGSSRNTPVRASHSARGFATRSKPASVFSGPMDFIASRGTPPWRPGSPPNTAKRASPALTCRAPTGLWCPPGYATHRSRRTTASSAAQTSTRAKWISAPAAETQPRSASARASASTTSRSPQLRMRSVPFARSLPGGTSHSRCPRTVLTGSSRPASIGQVARCSTVRSGVSATRSPPVSAMRRWSSGDAVAQFSRLPLHCPLQDELATGERGGRCQATEMAFDAQVVVAALRIPVAAVDPGGSKLPRYAGPAFRPRIDRSITTLGSGWPASA
jgi:hypothetical protein